MGFASAGSNPAPPIRSAYSFVLKSLIRTITGSGCWAAAMRAMPRERWSTKYSVGSSYPFVSSPIRSRASSSSSSSRWTRAIGWILMTLLTMNSIRASPMPLVGSRHHRKAAAGLATIIMMRVSVSGRSDRSTSCSSYPSSPR